MVLASDAAAVYAPTSSRITERAGVAPVDAVRCVAGRGGDLRPELPGAVRRAAAGRGLRTAQPHRRRRRPDAGCRRRARRGRCVAARRHDLIHVDDAVDAFLRCLGGKADGRRLNIGSGTRYDGTGAAHPDQRSRRHAGRPGLRTGLRGPGTGAARQRRRAAGPRLGAVGRSRRRPDPHLGVLRSPLSLRVVRPGEPWLAHARTTRTGAGNDEGPRRAARAFGAVTVRRWDACRGWRRSSCVRGACGLSWPWRPPQGGARSGAQGPAGLRRLRPACHSPAGTSARSRGRPGVMPGDHQLGQAGQDQQVTRADHLRTPRDEHRDGVAERRQAGSGRSSSSCRGSLPRSSAWVLIRARPLASGSTGIAPLRLMTRAFAARPRATSPVPMHPAVGAAGSRSRAAARQPRPQPQAAPPATAPAT